MDNLDKIRKTIQKSQRFTVFRRDKYLCGYCEDPKRKKPSSLSVDYIIPVRYGGFHGLENWVADWRT
ncbi:MAG: hypothetical protein COT91_05085 [Candidatus Doudnabacteria bacterium CG10_big_fil_rev_8_21_14_0_10_41_10]|uniref:HNH domain-containing protein n=1 Tax=Candidatus Doudnabacteria bacterium CG10_big_fil_rev_8_21_14_0_10_41_10 TaxID=1974551 RepID=A0A2H0VC82_9BACT|nr:MAG: hypothetical protein COT91_05085 [Candidatus Doudnabacteria bacterium CG10_big_fil_rev_8_21_14_0_10_41_10]